MLKHLLVGAVSRRSRTVVAPLERAKIEYMLDSTTIARDGGLVGTLRRIIRNEGPGGLFRGNTLNVFLSRRPRLWNFSSMIKSRIT